MSRLSNSPSISEYLAGVLHETFFSVTNKRPLSWLHIDLHIHSSNDDRILILLLDVLHVSVNILQRLVVFLKIRFTSPCVWQVNRQKQKESFPEQ